MITVDRKPEQEMLANTLPDIRTNGGGPYEVRCDLAGIKVNFPLAAVCLV